MVERSKAGAAKITVKDFDDPEARAMHDVDLDLSDSARALIRNGINVDDRTALQKPSAFTAREMRHTDLQESVSTLRGLISGFLLHGMRSGSNFPPQP